MAEVIVAEGGATITVLDIRGPEGQVALAVRDPAGHDVLTGLVLSRRAADHLAEALAPAP